MTRAQAVRFAARRDFWLCMARAFAAPGGEAFHAAFAGALAEDLAAITEEIGLGVAGDIEAFTGEVRMLADDVALQRLHAALFSTPPAPVFINTAIYVDGAFLGESELDIGRIYERHGFVRDPAFHDLNDHVSVQFEFLAALLDRAVTLASKGEDIEALAAAAEAERFLRRHPRRWIGPFLKTLQEACAAHDLAKPHLHLARIVWAMIEHEMESGITRFEPEIERPLPEGSARGVGEVTAEDLAEIADRLVAAGLTMDHVTSQPGWSDEVYARRRGAAPT